MDPVPACHKSLGRTGYGDGWLLLKVRPDIAAVFGKMADIGASQLAIAPFTPPLYRRRDLTSDPQLNHSAKVKNPPPPNWRWIRLKSSLVRILPLSR